MNDTKLKTVTEFVRENQITVDVLRVHENPNRDRSNKEEARWDRGASHWSVQFRFEGMGAEMNARTFETYYSMGAAHTKAPKAVDVLNCMAMDASSVENARSFEEWASELGYDEDSRRAEHTFKLCETQAQELKAFLGAERYEELLWKTERE